MRGNARDLKCFLEPILSEHACPAYVTPILIWANPDVTSYDKDCVIDVWKINELPRKIDELKQKPQKISDKCYKEIEKNIDYTVSEINSAKSIKQTKLSKESDNSIIMNIV